MSSSPSSAAGIHSEVRQGCLVVTILETQLRDFEKVTQVKLAIIAALQQHQPQTVLLDLQHVTYIGSVGFLAFLGLRREKYVENVVLCNVAPNVHQLFSICKLIPDGSSMTAPLKIADTLDSAMATYCAKADF